MKLLILYLEFELLPNELCNIDNFNLYIYIYQMSFPYANEILLFDM